MSSQRRRRRNPGPAIAPSASEWVGGRLSAPFWVSGPALQSLITREIPPDIQGEMQGSLVSLTSLAAIVNPLLMTQVFAHFSRRGSGVYLPGAPYFLGALVCLAVWALLLMSPKPGSAGRGT